MAKYEFKTQPMQHQHGALRFGWSLNELALLCAMGTGKTKIVVDLACARFLEGQIERLVVICPTPLKSTWADEFAIHAPIDYTIHALKAGRKPDKWLNENHNCLKIFVVGIESLSQGGERTKHGNLRVDTDKGAFGYTKRFIGSSNGSMIAVDESSKIKTSSSIRTKRVIELGGYSDYRVIMSGTPVTQGMEDLYAQYAFLNKGILDCPSYTVFKSKYCIMGGFERRQIIGYQFKDDLIGKIKPYTFQVTAEECLDLPKTVSEKVYVEPSHAQKKIIKDLVDEAEAEQDGKTISTEHTLELYTRIQQVVGGSFPYWTGETDNNGIKIYGTEPIKGKNPKIDALLDIVTPMGSKEKVIIFARFAPEQKYIEEALAKKFGKESIARYTGSESESERQTNKELFEKDDNVRFFITNQQVGAFGLNLQFARIMIFYSNSFSYEERHQAEKRTDRKGQTRSCIYFDIEMQIKYDTMIMEAIANKKDVADYVTGELM